MSTGLVAENAWLATTASITSDAVPPGNSPVESQMANMLCGTLSVIRMYWAVCLERAYSASLAGVFGNRV